LFEGGARGFGEGLLQDVGQQNRGIVLTDQFLNPAAVPGVHDGVDTRPQDNPD
jgi:hypothetical protein